MSDTTPAVPLVDKAKFILGGLVVGLLIGGGGAGYVWWTGQQEVAAVQAKAADDVEALETEAAEDLAAAEKVAEQISNKIETLQAREARLSARVEVARARDALDEANYGIVNDHLEKAAQQLDGVEGTAEVVSDLKAYKVDVSNPAASDNALQGFAGQIESLLEG